MECVDVDRFYADHGSDANPTYGYMGLDDAEKAAYADRDLFKYMVHHQAEVHTVDRNHAVLDVDGFTLVHAPTAILQTELTIEGTKERYLNECATHVRAATGACLVLPFDYVLRTGVAWGAEEFTSRGTYCCNRPHNDHTFASARDRIHDLLPSPYDADFGRSRYAIVNAWRRWDGGNKWPLACATYDSVDYENDLVECDLIYKHRTGHSFNISNKSTIQYNFFRDMSKDELLIFKIADTEGAKCCIHTGVENKDAPDTDPARISVEARFVVLWDEEIAAALESSGAEVPVAHNIVSTGFAAYGPSAKDESKRELDGEKNKTARKHACAN